MLSHPKMEFRNEQHYVAIRTKVKMSEIPNLLPPLIPEVIQWVEKNNIAQTGPCFFRYLAFDSVDELLVDVGVPTETEVEGDERIITGSFPAADYATVIYTGDYHGLKNVHMGLESWMKENELEEGGQEVDGKTYGARTEHYITDPQEVPDPKDWQTEVSILLANT
jgi:effector-binding domain-containing protein